MSKKNINQIALPFEFNSEDIKSYAKQHWNITFAYQKEVSPLAKKMIGVVMGMISADDNEFKPYYRFHISEIYNNSERFRYDLVKRAFNDLTDLKWLIEDIDKKKFAYRHLLNTTHADCGYDNGYITIALNPLLKDFFLNLAHYTTYNLHWYMTFKKWYAMRLYELLSAHKDTYYTVGIDNYRKLMDCESKHTVISTFINHTIVKPQIELQNTDMAFNYTLIYGDSIKGKGGRKPIVAISFQIKNKKLRVIPQKWEDKSPEHKILITTITKKWKVHHGVFMDYIPFIGMNGASRLMKKWIEKNHSQKPIQDVERYCNKSFADEGKRLKKLKNNTSNESEALGQNQSEADVVQELKDKLKSIPGEQIKIDNQAEGL